MTIEIETKTGMGERALKILEELKDVMIEKIVIKDEAFLEKQRELESIVQNVKEHPERLLEHEEVWRKLDRK